ncbi:MAG TPA: SBBP repeat-containing protein [Bryobacteraceae bacterium]|nr:SBBP repeat-containing protein [Bryobacteraceae bacterium]
MTTFRCAGVLLLVASYLTGAQLTSSTYLRSSFSPAAITTDSVGNIYLAGNILLDPLTSRQGVLVLKLNPQGAPYLYETYINGSTGESVGGIAIDNAGNAYIAGTTMSTDFPLTPGGALTSPSTGFNDPRPFLVRLDSNGIITLSTIFGGQGGASAVAIAADGSILISGVSYQKGFPSTPGAYSVPDSTDRPYLVKLDPATPKILFSATGIGGTSIALDTAGNIFVSGLTGFPTDYPTTPGAYQTQFQFNSVCELPCQLVFPGPNQYVTKIDPTGSKLIYSTGLNPPHGDGLIYPNGDPNAIDITNADLVVDAFGNAYVTGVTVYPHYPFTTPPPPNLVTVPFVSKLDPTGSKLLFSVPAGGSSLQLDGVGNLTAAGILYGPVPPSSAATSVMVGLPANFPSQCLPNNVTSLSEGYLQQLDPTTGTVRSAQFIDGSIVSSAVIALGSDGKVWMSGAVSRPDIPLTLNALIPPNFGPAPQPGAYLASIALSEPTTPTGPQLSCVLDSADMMHAGPIAPGQLLTLMGSNLGPEKGVSASAGGSTSLAGVTVEFDDIPAKLLYVSSSQVNVAVPGAAQNSAFIEPNTVMQIKVNGAVSALRLFPLTSSTPSLFADLFASPPASCTQGYPPPALARNADGSINSCLQPSKPGSIISLYVNGVGIGTGPYYGFFSIFDWDVVINGASAEVMNVANENDWVTRVDVRLPASLTSAPGIQAFNVTMRESGLPVGPLSLTPELLPGLAAGTSLPLVIWVDL